MNAFSSIKRSRARNTAAVLRGVATITLDHNMANHRVRSDREALEHDRKALQRDLQSVWNSLTSAREFDAA